MKHSSYKYIAICTALSITAGTFAPGFTAFADESVISELEISTEADSQDSSQSASQAASQADSEEELLLAIGDVPQDDEALGISSDEDITALTDGSMIPEYSVTTIDETSANVVTENYTEARTSTAKETMEESSAVSGGEDNLLEVVDDVDDFSAFSSGLTTIAQDVSNMVSTVIASSERSTSDSDSAIEVNTAPTVETTSIVSTVKSAISSVTSGNISVPVIATTAGRQALINYAKQFLGNPYVYGGTSLTEGADCSGFVQQIFKYFGITTGRSSRDQIENAQAISFEELQPGDLVFYASGDYVNHVAIYAGNGVIIHAASSKTGICTGRYDYREPYAYGRFLSN
ncbi:C40 family peptidase [Oribacterium sp. P6A1]|uniref:C40 family peptidase n=1 Tax=Oribacterium sp. P6A1 TaxID=1410612 RepID=UPI00055C3AA7|nr:C40 family peptidase [Oribacterium sp. P6A1]